MQKKIRKDRIFILVSIIFLFSLVCTYGYRLIHYYRQEHKKIEPTAALKDVTIYDAIISNIEEDELLANTSNFRLDETTKEYYFKNDVTNNYVYYSGRLFRVISIDKNNNIKMITDDIQSIISYNGSNYEESDLLKWLNNGEEKEGIFYNSLNNPSTFLVNTITCSDIVDDTTKSSCNKTNNKNLIELLSVYDYIRAGANQGYLNNNTTFWTNNNTSENEAWYIFKEGGLSKTDGNNQYGIRPVVTLKGETVINGKGTKEEPYTFETKVDDSIKSASVGEYLTYSGNNFRIISKDDKTIKVSLDGYLKEDKVEIEKSFSNTTNTYNLKNKDNIAYYLNNDFYKTLEDNEFIKKNIFYNGSFVLDNYSYKELYDIKTEANVGLYQVGELFITDYPDILTMSGLDDNKDDTIYVINSEGKLYADKVTSKYKIRPVIYLDNTLKIASGSGSKKDPYIVSR